MPGPSRWNSKSERPLMPTDLPLRAEFGSCNSTGSFRLACSTREWPLPTLAIVRNGSKAWPALVSKRSPAVAADFPGSRHRTGCGFALFPRLMWPKHDTWIFLGSRLSRRGKAISMPRFH